MLNYSSRLRKPPSFMRGMDERSCAGFPGGVIVDVDTKEWDNVAMKRKEQKDIPMSTRYPHDG
jgi:hypothetical protein